MALWGLELTRILDGYEFRAWGCEAFAMDVADVVGHIFWWFWV